MSGEKGPGNRLIGELHGFLHRVPDVSSCTSSESHYKHPNHTLNVGVFVPSLIGVARSFASVVSVIFQFLTYFCHEVKCLAFSCSSRNNQPYVFRWFTFTDAIIGMLSTDRSLIL